MVELPGNVLIVDDDRATREFLTTLLSTEGFHTIAAEDGLEALHMLRTVRRRAPDVPCLILLDLAMPRLGGAEFRRAQLGDPIIANVPVVVMSGLSDLVQRARTMGAVATVAKPFDMDLLLEVVRRCCSLGAIALRPAADGLPHRGRQNRS